MGLRRPLGAHDRPTFPLERAWRGAGAARDDISSRPSTACGASCDSAVGMGRRPGAICAFSLGGAYTDCAHSEALRGGETAMQKYESPAVLATYTVEELVE